MLFLSLLCCMLCSCGLSKYGIKEAWVFTEERFRGNIQVDDEGNPVTKAVLIEMSIFLETKTQDLPVWTSVELDGKVYKITGNKIVKTPFSVGKKKADETPVTINIAPGNFCYRLLLDSYDPENHPAINTIKLHGESASGDVTLRLKKKAIPLLPQMIP